VPYRGTSRLALIAIAITTSLAADAAAADDRLEDRSAPQTDPGATEVHAVLGDQARLRGDGLYAVRVSEDERFLTHGPDPAPVLGPSRQGGAGGPQRPPACATDSYTHVLLARPRKSNSKTHRGRPGTARRARHRASVALRQANALLNASSLAAGGPSADLEVKCDRRGRVALSRIRYRDNDFDSLVEAARRRGFDSVESDYLILVRGPNPESCGASSFEGDERLSAINVNNVRGGYAIVYRRCWTADGILHEIGHLQGAVQYRAPFSTGDGRHCWDARDVMCYAPDGGDLHQSGTISRCSTISFDCGNDTYFDPAPEAGEWLAEHWNLGSPLNAYIRFGKT
jgi:hypothetical protein